MPTDTPPRPEVSGTFDAKVGKARVVAALMRARLMAEGPIVTRVAGTNEAEAIAREMTGRPLRELVDAKLSWSAIARSPKANADRDRTFLWLNPNQITADPKLDADLAACAQRLADRSSREGQRPWNRRYYFPGDGDSGTERFGAAFPITFGVGIGVDSDKARLMVTVHSARSVDIAQVREILRQVARVATAVDGNDIGLLGDDIPHERFKFAKAETMRPGYSISRERGPASSIGMFVRHAGDKSAAPYLMGSGHALGVYGNEHDTSTVVFVAEDHKGTHSPIADVTSVHFETRHRSTQYLDVALAKLRPAVHCAHDMPVTHEALYGPHLDGVRSNDAVSMIGCTTGRRSGYVQATDVDVELVGRGGRVYRYVNQLQCASRVDTMGGPGDSGGLVVDGQARIAGQISGWIRDKSGTRSGGIYATPILHILEGLDLEPYNLEL